jgi:undecaprenyl-phosphate galactose phosphotransferase
MAQEEIFSLHDPADLVGYGPVVEGWPGSDEALVTIPNEALVTVPSFRRSLLGRSVKRAIDLVLSVIGLAVALPLIALISIAIMVETPGSPVFIHRRMGKSGREFGMVKFRTMIPRAQERLRDLLSDHPELMNEWQSLQKVRSDPRITRVGRFLRKYSLDEIPQLLNVIWGQMSLVGPRPIVRDEVERFGDQMPLIQCVRPGLTGLWAVSGRTDASYEDRVALESRYVRDWSPVLDARILLRTIPRVFRGSGAY